MTLYLIGLGLGNEKDISVKGLEIVKKCDIVFLESYTSILSCNQKDLEKYYGKKMIVADRELVEKKAEEILEPAKKKKVAFLVVGDVFGATTHADLYLRAKEMKIDIEIVHNTSILNAVGVVGLELYKYGKVTTIPLDNKNIRSPMDAIKMNKRNGLHTLVLFDIKMDINKMMNAKDAIDYLLREGFDPDEKIVVCCQIGGEEKIYYGKISELKKKKFDKYPQCMIIPGKLHFVEEEMLRLWE